MTGDWLVALLLLAASLDPAGLDPAQPGSLRLYLVRHAEAYSNLSPTPAGLTTEQLDALTPQGERQGTALGSTLDGIDVRLILHAPTKRAKATADLIRGARRIVVREEKELRRLDLGASPSGRPLDLADRVEIWKTGRDPRPPGGESLEDVGLRVLEFAHLLLRQRPSGGVVMVTHAEVISAFLGHIRGTDGAQRYPPNVPLASVTVVDVAARDARELLARYEPKPR